MRLLSLVAATVVGEYCGDAVCNFELDLRYRFTMSCHEPDRPGFGDWFPVEINENGEIIQAGNNMYVRDSAFKFNQTDCIFGNGNKTAVVTINDQFPAEPLEVTEGALVYVKVKNNLFGGVSPVIHFHGFKFDQGHFW